MIARLAFLITDQFIKEGVIPSDDREIYQYGFEVGMAQAANIISTLIIGLLLRMQVESICFLVSFMTLRTYVGGYHSASHFKCYILSVLVTTATLFSSKIIIHNDLSHIVVIAGIIGFLLILLLAPIEDQNKPMDSDEKVVYRKRVIRNLLIWSAIIGILAFTPFKNISFVLCMCLFIMGITAFCGHCKNQLLLNKKCSAQK